MVPKSETGAVEIRTQRSPAIPKYASYESRLTTFKTWNPDFPKRPKDLAADGFFYLGYKDCMKCFYCGESFACRSPKDNHCLYSSHCLFRKQRRLEQIGAYNTSLASQTVPVSVTQTASAPTLYPSQLQPSGPTASAFIDVQARKRCHREMEGKTCSNLYPAMLPIICNTAMHIAEKLVTDGAVWLKEKCLPFQCGLRSDDSVESSDETDPTDDRDATEKKTATAPRTPSASEIRTLLQRENHLWKSRVTCKICLDQEVNAVFLPYGHVACTQCASACRTTHCNQCSKEIHGICSFSF